MPWTRLAYPLTSRLAVAACALALLVGALPAQADQFGSGTMGIGDDDCPGPGCPLNTEDILQSIERQRDALKRNRIGDGGAVNSGVHRGITIFDNDGKIEIRRRKPIRILADQGDVPAGLPDVRGDLSITVGVEFARNSARIQRKSEPLLEQLCNAMKAQAHQAFFIVGHTDAGGDADYNLQLSRQRAQSVEDWLLGNCSETFLLESVGLGEERLLPQHPPGSPLQRRVEIIVRL